MSGWVGGLTPTLALTVSSEWPHDTFTMRDGCFLGAVSR